MKKRRLTWPSGLGRGLAARLGTLLLTLLLGGFLGATLVRLGPGFASDERELDPRLNADSIARLHRLNAKNQSLPRYYFLYLSGLLRGDLGVSRSLGRPVSELLRERLPTTLETVGFGLAAGWAGALALAVLTHVFRSAVLDFAFTLSSGILLCLPAVVLALIILYWSGPAPLSIAAIVFPRVFRYCRNLLLDASRLPHVIFARAKGLRKPRVLFRHIFPSVGPELRALLGVSLSMAFTAAIPVEAVCDSPGIGQLAWQAALARDLPLLTNLTLIVTAVTLGGNFLCTLKPAEMEAPSA